MDEEMEEAVESARRTPLSEVCHILDLDLAKGTWDEGFMYSIFHDENTPSMHVSDDAYWFDFSSGKGGDTIGLVQAHFGCSFRRAVHFIHAGVDPEVVIPERQRKQAAPPPDLTGYFTETLTRNPAAPRAEFDEWLDDCWSIPTPVLTAAFHARFIDTGSGIELWAPHYHETKITGIKIRSYPDRKKWSVPGSKFLSLYTAIYQRNTNEAWLVEGESDCWGLWAASPYLQVFGLPSGAAMWRDEWVHTLRRYSVHVCLDDDKAGQEASEKIMKTLSDAGVTCTWATSPEGRVAESLQAGWRP